MPFVKGKSGNPNGRPKKAIVTDLENAIKKVEGKKRKSFLEHLVERAYESDQVLIAVSNKLIPNLKHVETDLDANLSGTLVVKWKT